MSKNGRAPIHGHTVGRKRSPTWRAWSNMRERCKPDKPYGKRGITICERWAEFAHFLADMGERPEGLELDRRDPLGHYEPSNCRWRDRLKNHGETRRNLKNKDEVRKLFSEGMSRKNIANTLSMAPSSVCQIINGRM